MRRVVMILIVLAMAVPAMAQQEPPCQVDQAMSAVTRFLALTDEQVAGWQDALDARRAAAEPLRTELADTRDQLAALLDEAEPDAAAVGELTIQAHDLGDELRAVDVEYLDAFQEMLTEEQAGRLAFLRRADRAQPVLPAFRLFGLLAPPPPPED